MDTHRIQIPITCVVYGNKTFNLYFFPLRHSGGSLNGAVASIHDYDDKTRRCPQGAHVIHGKAPALGLEACNTMKYTVGNNHG